METLPLLEGAGNYAGYFQNSSSVAITTAVPQLRLATSLTLGEDTSMVPPPPQLLLKYERSFLHQCVNC